MDGATPGPPGARGRRGAHQAGGPGSFGETVASVVAAIPAGTVLTYGEVAMEAGRPGAARAVGTLLSRSGGTLPWWRVVASTGRLVPGHEPEHARRLGAEGVPVRNGRVVLSAGRPAWRTGGHPAAPCTTGAAPDTSRGRT